MAQFAYKDLQGITDAAKLSVRLARDAARGDNIAGDAITGPLAAAIFTELMLRRAEARPA